ncbi:MAG TPA: DUF4252 domain-containing protein [Terriglobales bacterium]|nr:DUF4252 domain-containing protein [Terriglobales bacterium]
MKVLKIVLICLLMMTCSGFTQELKFPADLDRLASKANEVVDVTMDKTMLAFASRFLSGREADEVQAKNLIRNLNGIYVKSFEFDKPGVYSAADIESFRAQLKAPVWSRMVEARSKRDGQDVEVFFKMDQGKVTGMAIIAAEPRELTLVHIDGPIDPEQLGSLGGQFGIPKIDVHESKSKPSAKPVKK